MKVLITGDWHLHEKGTRAQVILNFLDYIWAFYKKNNIELLAINGDIFDRSGSIKNSFFIPLSLKLHAMKEDGVNFIFCIGNHDIINVDNDSIIETFQPYGKVVKKSEVINCGGTDITFLSYTKNEEDIPKSGDVMITHLSIADFEFDNAFHATEKHAFQKALFENYNKVFTGHFHKHQAKDNIVYVGSPCQMNRGEIGQTKGFVVYDTERETWKFEEYADAPKYFEINNSNIMDLENIDLQNKVVVVRIDKKSKDFAKLRYVLYEKGAIEIIPMFEAETEVDVSIEEKVEMKTNIEDIMKEVISKLDVGLDNEKLLTVFNEILEKT